MSIAPSFALLEQTLEREGVLCVQRRSPFVPWQRLVTSEKELGESFEAFLAEHGATRSMLVFVDGVAKECGVGVVDDVLRFVLDGVQIDHRWIDLSRVLRLPPPQVHASTAHLPKIREVLRASKEGAVLALGSGALTDLVKHAMHEEGDGRPLLVMPTALTVTAYTSAFAVLEEAGAKRTRVSRPVTGCLWFSPVIAQAPGSMSRAGFGDLLARFVAYGDWYLSHELGMAEHYDERAYRLMEPYAETLKESATDFASEVLPARCVERVSAALAMAGIAMSVSGETTPLSGYEHVISHALDFLRLTSGRPLVLHGEQVALGSYSSATSFDVLFEQPGFDPSRFRHLAEQRIPALVAQLIEQAPFFGEDEVTLTEKERKKRLSQLEGGLEDARTHFTHEYLKKQVRWKAFEPRLPEFLERWPEIRARMRAFTLPAREMEVLLNKAKLPLTPEDLEPSTTALEYRWALRFSPFIRSRVSLGDFLFWIGEDPVTFAGV